MSLINVNTFNNSGRAQAPAPEAGQITLSTKLDFTGAAQEYLLDPTSYILNKSFWPQAFGVFIDNSNGANEIVVSVIDTGYTFPVPSFTAGWFPVFSTAGSKYRLEGAGGSGSLTAVLFCNWEQVPFTYSGFTPFRPGDQVEVFPGAASNIISRNTVIVPGGAVNVFPAVGVASAKSFENASTGDMWYNFNVIAVGNQANGDQLLSPGEHIDLPFAWAHAISFFSATGGLVLAYEWS